jgi:hypothetical protein
MYDNSYRVFARALMVNSCAWPNMNAINFNVEDIVMSENKTNPTQAGNQQGVPDQAAVGTDGNDGNRQREAQPAESGRYTDFPSASPESNVNPPGRAQNSHGSATYPVAGGTQGGFEASQRAVESRQAGTADSDAAGNAGATTGNADTADRGASRREG